MKRLMKMIENSSNMMGALILGKGFLLVDLIRYTVGIGLAAGMDKVMMMLNLRKQN
ncbi:hypothetical protein RCG19_06910 [Neobacillus sp. OS1-2]|uniref:hypothetical protein n=1 Tax=Neobacillus sp. OS1-2 TaxID=3070680 RepID=UPI0027E21350|nr:hypothetical protein [Neobacillus sp. OS1-2]WML41380.1 hypothetical protein RCG19_06910 [Neobacillus sp. OS1-2]